MGSRGWMVGIAMVAGVLGATCDRTGRSSERGRAAPSAGVSEHPQPWEPMDEGFRGCEGG